MIVATIIFFATLIAKLIFDFKLWQQGKPNNHWYGPAIVAIILVVCSWLAGWLSVGIWFMGWWLIFNASYAILIGQKWNYLGSTSKLDIFEKANKWVTPAKYAVFALSLTLYICLK